MCVFCCHGPNAYRFALPSSEDIQNAIGEVKSMDKDIEAIIAREAGIGGLDDKDTTDDLIESEEFESDAYTEADVREEMIELQNDTIDTLVNDSQDASTEGIDDGGWNHDD
jgi:N utilization substance protein A